jgi:hypothetical protein
METCKYFYKFNELQEEHQNSCLKKCVDVNDDMLQCCNISALCENRVHVSCSLFDPFQAQFLNFWFCATCVDGDDTGGLKAKLSKEMEKARSIAGLVVRLKMGEVDLDVLLSNESAFLELTEELEKDVECVKNLRITLSEREAALAALKAENSSLREKSSSMTSSTSSRLPAFSSILNKSRRERESAVNFALPSTNSTRYSSHNLASTFNVSSTTHTLADMTHLYPDYDAQERLANETKPERLAIMRDTLAKLVPFTGDVSQWASFKTSFVQSSARGCYRAIEDADRLRTLIQGDALKMYSPEIMHPFANPTDILKTLDRFYGLQGNALRHHLDVITHLRKVESRNDRSAILDLFASVKQYGLLCRQYKQETELIAESSLYAIESRMSDDLVTQWRRWVQKNNSTVSVDGIAAYLEEQMKRINERASINPSAVPQILTIASGGNSQRSRVGKRMECLNCCAQHPFWKCPDLSRATLSERQSIVRRLQMCENCLAFSNHDASNCSRRTPVCPVAGCSKTRLHPLLHGHDDREIQRYIHKE